MGGKSMFYKYESDFDNDLMFWSNATADLWHKGESGESDLPDELLHALNELWTDSHLVCCYLVEFKGRYGVALESIYDRDFAESLGVTYPKRRTAAWDINRKSAAMPPNCSMTGNRLWRLHPRSINRRKAYGAIPGKSLARINVRGTFSL